MDPEEEERRKRREKWRARKRQSRAKTKVREREKEADKFAKRKKRLESPLTPEERSRKNEERRRKYAERVGRPVRRYHRRAKKTAPEAKAATETSALAAATMAEMAKMPPSSSGSAVSPEGIEIAAGNGAKVAQGSAAALDARDLGAPPELRQAMLAAPWSVNRGIMVAAMAKSTADAERGGKFLVFQPTFPKAYLSPTEIHGWLAERQKTGAAATSPCFPVSVLETLVPHMELLQPTPSARLLQMLVLSGGSTGRSARVDVDRSEMRGRGVPANVDATLISRIDFIETGKFLARREAMVPDAEGSKVGGASRDASPPSTLQGIEMPAGTCVLFSASTLLRADAKIESGAICILSLWSDFADHRFDKDIVSVLLEAASIPSEAPEPLSYISQSDFVNLEATNALPKPVVPGAEVGQMEEI